MCFTSSCRTPESAHEKSIMSANGIHSHLILIPLMTLEKRMTGSKRDIHGQLRELLDREHATYRMIEHEPEGRTEVIAKIRGNRIEQSIKSIVIQVRLTRRENLYCLANVPGNCRIDFEGIQNYFGADSVAFASRAKAR